VYSEGDRMKCLSVVGTTSMRNAFKEIFLHQLPDKSVGILHMNAEGSPEMIVTGRGSLEDCISSRAPDIVLLDIVHDLAVPVVFCRSEVDITWEPLELARFTINRDDEPQITLREKSDPVRLEEGCVHLYERSFHFLPQLTMDQCGRCGTDCRELAEAVVMGERKAEECYLTPSSGLRILVDGQPIRLGRFPADLVEGTLKGLLSVLRGYREDADLKIEIFRS